MPFSVFLKIVLALIYLFHKYKYQMLTKSQALCCALGIQRWLRHTHWTEQDRAPKPLSRLPCRNSGSCVITYHSHSVLAFLIAGKNLPFLSPDFSSPISFFHCWTGTKVTWNGSKTLCCNQRRKDQSWQPHWRSGWRDFLFKIKIPDDPNIGKWAPAEHSAFCAESRKEAEITIEATQFHSFQPRGLDANCLPQQWDRISKYGQTQNSQVNQALSIQAQLSQHMPKYQQWSSLIWEQLHNHLSGQLRF